MGLAWTEPRRKTHRRTHWAMGSGLYYDPNPVLGTYRSIDFPRIGYRLGLVWFSLVPAPNFDSLQILFFLEIFFYPKFRRKFCKKFRRLKKFWKNPGKKFDFSINFLYNISMKSKEREGTIEPLGLSAYHLSPYLVGITSDYRSSCPDPKQGALALRIIVLKNASVHSYRELMEWFVPGKGRKENLIFLEKTVIL